MEGALLTKDSQAIGTAYYHRAEAHLTLVSRDVRLGNRQQAEERLTSAIADFMQTLEMLPGHAIAYYGLSDANRQLAMLAGGKAKAAYEAQALKYAQTAAGLDRVEKSTYGGVRGKRNRRRVGGQRYLRLYAQKGMPSSSHSPGAARVPQ